MANRHTEAWSLLVDYAVAERNERAGRRYAVRSLLDEERAEFAGRQVPGFDYSEYEGYASAAHRVADIAMVLHTMYLWERAGCDAYEFARQRLAEREAMQS